MEENTQPRGSDVVDLFQINYDIFGVSQKIIQLSLKLHGRDRVEFSFKGKIFYAVFFSLINVKHTCLQIASGVIIYYASGLLSTEISFNK